MYRQDVLANNLANIETVGFKPDIASSRPRGAVVKEDGVSHLPSNRLLERLGGGVLMNRNMVNLAQGTTRMTGNALDLALEGEGFFSVADPNAKVGGGQQATLTRDGRFTTNAAGQLVTIGTGWPVLDESQKPITLARGIEPSIGGDGVIRQGGRVVGQIAVMRVSDPSTLEKAGNSTFHAPARVVTALPMAERRIRHNAVEQSGVNEMATLMQMTGASREVDAHVSLMQAHDRMMDRAINSLGRVA